MSEEVRAVDVCTDEPTRAAERSAPEPVAGEGPINDRQLRRLLVLEGVLAARAAVVMIVVVAVIEPLGTGWYAHATRPSLAHASANVPRLGHLVGWIDIPRLGVHDAILEGVGRAQLRHGIGHVPHTAMPGGSGPMVLAGHSSMFGGPFGRVSQLVTGDLVNVAAAHGPVTHYVVAQTARPLGRTSTVAPNTGLVMIVGSPRFLPSRAIAVLATPVAPPGATPGPPVKVEQLVNRASVLRPSRPGEALSIVAALAVLGAWELLRAARRRGASTADLLAIAAAGAAPFLVLLISVAWAFPAVF
jgi:hypothetical protein